MTELASDYMPGVRFLEESTTAIGPGAALEVVRVVSAPLRRTVRIQSGFARHATVAGEVVGGAQ